MNLVGGENSSPTELTAFRIRYPAGFMSDTTHPLIHYHIGTEHVTVLSGTIAVGLGDKVDYGKVKLYGPGGFFVIPSGTPHYEWLRGETEVHVEAIGPMKTIMVNPADSERLQQELKVAARVQTAGQEAPAAPANGLSEWRILPNGMARMGLVGGEPPSPTELIAFRMRYPASFLNDSTKLIYHYHFGTEHIVVMKGTLMLGFGDHVDVSQAVAYGPGSFIDIPAGVAHFEWMRGEMEAHVEAIGPMSAVNLNPATGQPW